MNNTNIKAIYVVNYKETTLDNGMIVGLDRVDTGVCEYAFTNEEDAINKMWEMSDQRIEEFKEVYENAELLRDEEGGGARCVLHNYDWSFVCEYWVSKVYFEVK